MKSRWADHSRQRTPLEQRPTVGKDRVQWRLTSIRWVEGVSIPMVMVLALFHACSVWSDEAVNLSLCLSLLNAFYLLCFVGGVCVWKRFISSWVQLQWTCPVWQTEELDYNHLSLKARAVAVTSNIAPCGGRTGGKCWFRAAGCVDLKIIWKNRAVLPQMINKSGSCLSPVGFLQGDLRVAPPKAASREVQSSSGGQTFFIKRINAFMCFSVLFLFQSSSFLKM